MKILIQSISMPIEHTIQDVLQAAREIARLRCIPVSELRISRQSLDARRKGHIRYIYSVEAEVPDGTVCDGRELCPAPDGEILEIPENIRLPRRPVVVGMGPCGLFAAYLLAKSGNPPLLLEQGDPVEERTRRVREFWAGGPLDPCSNVQFGEGGAGTFSDGKLNTRISDPRQRYVLKTFAEHGGPEDILYRAKPHIGTDRLCQVVRSMRQEIQHLGGEVRFRTCLTGIRDRAGQISEIQLNHSETAACRDLVLAIGHSSRHTYRMLEQLGLALEPKPFAVGVRIEHRQRRIDMLQYGEPVPGLPPADYRLTYNGKERSCYSFCMCPGGQVVNASSEPEHLVVNGMSRHLRNGENANSALVVSVRPEDFLGEGPLAGVRFQQKYEALAWREGGGDGAAPVQLARDFLMGRPSEALGETRPSFTGRWRFARLENCLPEFVAQGLREGLESFSRRMPGFAEHGLLTGVEMRTSAPVRILRDREMESVSLRGLYPAGEGAGYAGGIVSAAVDGIRAALRILEKYRK